MKHIKIEFSIDTLEDFHIGTGLDKVGLYDDGQQKDENNEPLIKSETFKGLFRQSCREVKHNNNNYKDVYSEVFSFKNQNSLDIKLTPILKNQENPYIIHSFTEIDDTSHQAKKHSLRSIEFASKGVKFKGALSFLVVNDFKNNAIEIEKLLIDGLRNLRWIGGLRRRGFGSIKIDDIEKKIEDLEPDKEQQDVKSEILNIVLQLEDDTTISGAGITGNNMLTLDYIPGTSILGMIRVLLMKLNKNEDYFDDDKIRVTNFYPVPKDYFKQNKIDKYPIIIPIPLSLRRKKKTDIYKKISENFKNIPHWAVKQKKKDKISNIASKDILIEKKDKDTEEFSDKSFSGGYICFEDNSNLDFNKNEIFSVDTTLTIRNAIDKVSQTTKENSLFTQEQIKKGTVFLGKIVFDSIVSSQKFKQDFSLWLEGKVPFHVGRGGKPIKVVKYHFSGGEEQSIEFDDSKRFFTITLLSDAVLYDDNLQPAIKITPKILNNYCNTPIPEDKIKLVNTVYTTYIVQSYSGTAGLRRFSDRVIKKGSSFYFECKKEVNEEEWNQIKEALKKLQKKGIGFRKHEGFGQVIINHPIHDFDSKKADNISNNKEEMDFQEYKVADVYIENLKNNAYIHTKANNIKYNYFKDITASESFFNRMIGKLEAEISEEKMNNFLKHNEQRREAKDYNKFKEAWESLNNEGKEKKYEILKIALLMKKHKVGGLND